MTSVRMTGEADRDRLSARPVIPPISHNLLYSSLQPQRRLHNTRTAGHVYTPWMLADRPPGRVLGPQQLEARRRHGVCQDPDCLPGVSHMRQSDAHLSLCTTSTKVAHVDRSAARTATRTRQRSWPPSPKQGCGDGGDRSPGGFRIIQNFRIPETRWLLVSKAQTTLPCTAR
jgi:hypothetical protein